MPSLPTGINQTIKVTFPTVVAAVVVGLIACQSTLQSTIQSPGTGQSKEATAMPGKGVKVRPSTHAKPERRFFAEIIGIGLEKLDYDVEGIKQLSPSLAHSAVSNGDLDFFIPHLDKSPAQFFEKGGEDGKLERLLQD
ncbi:MAG TPA: hypothetical protein V6D11_16550 [Waterburya sp.]|jgi:ABC-type proline/glycine betaine transport system substrate-binding protein